MYNSDGEDVTIAAATSAAITDTLTANAPAGGTGATAGAYDSAANRDLMIATVNGLNATVADMIVQITALQADQAAALIKQNA